MSKRKKPKYLTVGIEGRVGLVNERCQAIFGQDAPNIFGETSHFYFRVNHTDYTLPPWTDVDVIPSHIYDSGDINTDDILRLRINATASMARLQDLAFIAGHNWNAFPVDERQKWYKMPLGVPGHEEVWCVQKIVLDDGYEVLVADTLEHLNEYVVTYEPWQMN